MFDVEVRNFQSIEHAKVRVDGFTALVGRSNIGKSALVRAIRSALTGAGGTAFVRHAPACARRIKSAKTCECYAMVHLLTDSFDLKWEKGDKINQYTFNGQVFDSIGQGTPDFLLRPQLLKDLGFVEFGKSSKLLQVADQFDNVFLLDQSGSVVADVLSDVARLDRINVAMRMVEKDRKDAAHTRKVRENDVRELETKLSTYDGLDRMVAEVQRVSNLLKEIASVRDRVSSLLEFHAKSSVLQTRIDALETACAVPVPDTHNSTTRYAQYEDLQRFLASLNEKAAVIRGLQGVEDVPDPNFEPTQLMASKHGALTVWVDKLRILQGVFGKLKPMETLAVPEVEKLTVAFTQFQQASILGHKIEVLTAAIDQLETDYEAAIQEEKAIHDEGKSLPGLCPTCDQPFHATHKHSERSVA